MKIKLFFAILIILSVFLSACDIYQTLYNVPSPVGEVVKVPEGDIVVDEESPVSEVMEEGEEEEVMEEAIVVEEGVEAATIVIVDETELISLVPNAEDPDHDTIEFIFSNPLDENGQWQTTYGDEGEYTVTVTVSDGELTNSKEVLIIVNKKEEAPTIDSFAPVEAALTADETEILDFSIEASDLNNDELIYVWKLDGDEISDENTFSYKTTYDDAGSHTIKVTVSDGKLSTDNLWSVTIKNVNRKPVLEKISDIVVDETDTVSINPQAVDPDGDDVSFTITDPVGNDDVWETSYDDAGEYTVTVTASDGIDEVSQKVAIIVQNVNRPPQIIDIVQK